MNNFYGILDILFVWLAVLPPLIAVILSGVVTAICLVVVGRWISKPTYILALKGDLKTLEKLSKEYRDDESKSEILRRRAGTTLGRYIAASFRPLKISLLPLILLGTWLHHSYQFEPIKESEPIQITAVFSSSTPSGLAHIDGGHEYLDGSPIALIETTSDTDETIAQWMITPGDGKADIIIVYRSQKVATLIQPRRAWHPPEITDSDAPGITAIRIGQRPLTLVKIGSLPLGWISIYLAASVIGTLLLQLIYRLVDRKV